MMDTAKSTVFKPEFPDPFNVEHFFNDFIPSNWRKISSDLVSPAVNIQEFQDQFLIDVIAPGFEKTDFKLDLDEANQLLTIYAGSKEVENKNYTRKEYHFHSFSRSFKLPEYVKKDHITAKYKDGILNINLPKSEVKSQTPLRQIAIS